MINNYQQTATGLLRSSSCLPSSIFGTFVKMKLADCALSCSDGSRARGAKAGSPYALTDCASDAGIVVDDKNERR